MDDRKEKLEEALEKMGSRIDSFQLELKKTYPAQKGWDLAASVSTELNPFIRRDVCVGSLGRNESRICDIDLLVEPSSRGNIIREIKEVLRGIGTWKRGGDRMMSIGNIYGSGLDLDVFLCHPPAQWGILTAVRLNPIPLVLHGKKILDSKKYIRKNASLKLRGKEVLVPTEEDWFELVGIPWVANDKRWELTRDLRLI